VLDWLLDPKRRRGVAAILNQGELGSTLARVCRNRLGEVRHRTFEAQRHRASGLNLVTAAIILWNTVYLERAVETVHKQSRRLDNALLQHIAPSTGTIST
jgi:TnpA family transposase